MRSLLALVSIVLVGNLVCTQSHSDEVFVDNEFAEFEEEYDIKTDSSVPSQPPQVVDRPISENDDDNYVENDSDNKDDDIVLVQDEESEFSHFQDAEEFEGYVTERSVKFDDDVAPKINITKVPLHLSSNWHSFYLEMLMGAGLVVYFINYFAGKTKNFNLANTWYSTHRSLLEENFSLVGDDGRLDNSAPRLMKDSESQYSLWCSGRTCCEGMLVELRLLKRQDLCSIVAHMIRPSRDQVHIRVEMGREDMDSFVFCVASKKTAARLVKDTADLSAYCPERRPGERFDLPSSFSVMSEIAEVAASILDAKVLAAINKYADLIDYIHLSDQFSGAKLPEDATLVKLPEVKKVLMFGLNMPQKGRSVQERMESMRPLLQLVFYLMEKVKRFRLTKEGKNKAEKNRLRVEEVFLKTTHVVRAEAAAARREEKRRQEKERILQEDDPEKQRKWEEKEMKRQMKKKAPKMKQLKVKAL